MSEQVQAMFSRIAHRYDRANTILSLGVHNVWRWKAIRMSEVQVGSSVLDCATGTGDLAIGFKRRVGRAGRVVGTDLNEQMLSYAPSKAREQGADVAFLRADVESLPFATNEFDVCSIAFGIRNVDHPLQALREMARVVRPGGRVVILEFGQPSGALGLLYRWYSRNIIPPLGALITGYREAYEYLPETAAAFPAGERFLAMMDATGAFASRMAKPLTGGVAYVYIGVVA